MHSRNHTLVELCAGTAAVSLRALGGPAAPGPLTGYMGGKRRWAGLLANLLGFGDRRPAEVVLVDAGPWGDAWTTLADAELRAEVAAHLEGWSGREPNELWIALAEVAPYADPARRCAQFLWLQARVASCIPIWWEPAFGCWTTPSGGKSGSMCAAGARQSGAKTLGPGKRPSRGLVDPLTLVRRIQRLDALDWERVTIIHGLVEDVEPIPGATVFFDPPYRGAPRYAEVLPRDRVLEVAQRWAMAGARVLVSEAEPLPLEGWSHARLPHTRPEALTASWPIHVARREQLPLFQEAA